jgi:hypothetical protein
MTETSTRTTDEIEAAGLEALRRELGPVDAIRFLRMFVRNDSDYSKDRHAWVESLTAEDIRKGVEDLRASGLLPSGRR